MEVCKKCGSKVYEGLTTCPNCGTSVGEQEPSNNPVPQPAPQPVPTQQPEFVAKVAKLNDTPDTTGDYDQADIEQNKVMGILAYLGWLVLIPLFAAKKSPFARFHTNQGLVLTIASIAFAVATAIVTGILGALSATLGALVGGLLSLASLAFFVLMILGIVNVASGKTKELPIIGKFRILK